MRQHVGDPLADGKRTGQAGALDAEQGDQTVDPVVLAAAKLEIRLRLARPRAAWAGCRRSRASAPRPAGRARTGGHSARTPPPWPGRPNSPRSRHRRGRARTRPDRPDPCGNGCPARRGSAADRPAARTAPCPSGGNRRPCRNGLGDAVGRIAFDAGGCTSWAPSPGAVTSRRVVRVAPPSPPAVRVKPPPGSGLGPFERRGDDHRAARVLDLALQGQHVAVAVEQAALGRQDGRVGVQAGLQRPCA
jgi:hypothetical protein